MTLMKLFQILLALLSLSILIYVILVLPYPESLTQASVFQLISFFLPLLFFLTLTANLFLNSLASSFSLAFGIILILILKALDDLNFLSFVLTVAAVLLLISQFKGSLTSNRFMPKLGGLRRKRE